MEIKTLDEKTIRKYLLGQATSGEQDEIELWLMSEESACNLLTVVEDELIDESLAGELKGEELERFHNYFLMAPERVHKLQLSRSFHQVVGASNSAPDQSPKPSRANFWAMIAHFIQFRPAWRYAVSALLLLLAVGTVVEIVQLRQGLTLTQVQLNDTRSQNEKLTAELQVNSETIPASPAFVSMLVYRLEPSILMRSATDKQLEISITSNDQQVDFHLALPADDNSDSYQVTLLNSERNSTATFNGLSANKSNLGREVIARFSASQLTAGDLMLALTGHSRTPSEEPLSLKYHFTIVRR